MEKNDHMSYTKPPDLVLKPGPVLQRAMAGKYRKGKRPKSIPSAAQAAEAMARAWKG